MDAVEKMMYIVWMGVAEGHSGDGCDLASTLCRHEGMFGSVCCVAAVVKDDAFCRGVLKYVVYLCKGCDGCCVFCLYCEAWSCKCSCMGSVNFSSCRCCMFVSCVHHAAVLSAAFYMTYSLLTLVEVHEATI